MLKIIEKFRSYQYLQNYVKFQQSLTNSQVRIAQNGEDFNQSSFSFVYGFVLDGKQMYNQFK